MTKHDSSLKDSLRKVEQQGSYGEKQIARMLQHYGIRFSYEHPIAVVDRGHVRVWYPDFWLPDLGVVVEYAGVIHDDDYTEGVRHKTAVYQASGFACICLDTESLKGRWPQHLFSQIRDAVIERQDCWDSIETLLLDAERESRESTVYAWRAWTRATSF